LREAVNAHTEVVAAREATLQAHVEAAQEIQRVKEAIARQAKKEVTALKKKLEVTERKAKDAADDLQAVVESKLRRSPKVGPVYSVGLLSDFSTLNECRRQGDLGRPEEGASGDQGSSEDPQGEDRGGPSG
jgi:hypothetical protein